MIRPQRIAGQGDEISPEAIALAGPGGLVIIKCVIQVSGVPENCRVIKPLHGAEAHALRAIQTWRFEPATFKGKPVAVDYMLNVRLKPQPAQ